MAVDSQGIAIAGFSLLYPLLQLLETLEAAPPVEPNEVQTGARENGYSAAIVVLSVFLLESAINRVRYFEKDESRKPGAAKYFASRNPKLAKAVYEVFTLRDAIVHGHVWDEQTRRVPGQGLAFVEQLEIRKAYGDERFRNMIDSGSLLSPHLKLNLFPPRIWRQDAHIVLQTVKHALMALDSMKPPFKDRDTHNFPCVFRDQDMGFYEVIEEVLEGQAQGEG